MIVLTAPAVIVLPALSVTLLRTRETPQQAAAFWCLCHIKSAALSVTLLHTRETPQQAAAFWCLCHIESAALPVTLLQAGETPQQAAAIWSFVILRVLHCLSPSPYQRDASTGCSILVLCHIESAALCVTLLQAGETPQQAAAKNVKRETGLDLDPSRFRAVCTASYLWSMRKQEPSSTWVLGVCGWSAA
jgi:hypothetical protein